jgi:hypothetical protein
MSMNWPTAIAIIGVSWSLPFMVWAITGLIEELRRPSTRVD